MNEQIITELTQFDITNQSILMTINIQNIVLRHNKIRTEISL